MNNLIVAAVIGTLFNITIVTIVVMMAVSVSGWLQVAGFLVAATMLSLASVRTYKRFIDLVK